MIVTHYSLLLFLFHVIVLYFDLLLSDITVKVITEWNKSTNSVNTVFFKEISLLLFKIKIQFMTSILLVCIILLFTIFINFVCLYWFSSNCSYFSSLDI